MRFSLKVILITLAAVVFMSTSAMASSFSISDKYYGADDHGYGDVIGAAADFGISKMNINVSGSKLTFDVYTNFAGLGDNKLFAAYTKSPNGIGYGDLLLSSDWTPYGSQPYLGDNNLNGTKWTFGLVLDNRWSATGGTLTLFKLNGGTNDANLLLSGDLMKAGSGAVWRDGQEVAVDTLSATVAAVSTGTWSVESGYLRFNIDVSGTSLLNGPELAFHWGPTCANDVIEGGAPVPEPATMLLVGSGLVGLVGLGRRRLIRK